jgi:integrase
VRLTDISIRNLKPPEKGQKIYWCDTLKGFGVRCSQGGTKTYVLMHGANRQLTTLGRVGVIKQSEARDAAKTILAERTLGKHQPTRISYDDALSAFLEHTLAKNRARTADDYERLLRRHFALGREQLASITKQELHRRLNRLKDTPSEQHHAFAAARVFFRWAQRMGYVRQSPLDGISFTNPPSRERILDDEELKAIYQRALEYDYPYGAIVVLLTLTGQRKSEIAGLKWEWIKDNTVTIPMSYTKSNRTHTFPLSDQAASIIYEIPKSSDYLFPASRIRSKNTTVFNGWSKAKADFDEPFDFHYRLHDIRRTVVTGLASLGVSLPVIERLVGHTSGTFSGVVGIYQRYNYLPEMTDAVQRWDDHLNSFCSG